LPKQLTRPELVALADRMLVAVRPFASPGHARITLPGKEGGYGRAVDGLEGFARTFLMAGFRIAGDPHSPASRELAEWYAQGIATGTDPDAPDRWVRLPEHGQAKVEAASLALILDMTRPYIWDQLDAKTQERVVEYLSPAVGDETYPQINWVWFRLVVQTFLRSVGGPFSLAEMRTDLATHDSFARGGGWMSDGPSRAYDHYIGWALHLYPTLWARMAGAQDLSGQRAERDRAALGEFLRDLVTLVGADGSPLLQGRSLIYRFAAAAPFWVGACAGVESVPLGQLRRAATATIGHFLDHGAPDADGLLTMGWHGEWRRLAQSYSGPGSPYWAAKGMLGLALPEDHPVWTAPEVLLPIEERDTLSALPARGWLVSGTKADGIVRIVNHGTDHAHEGSALADSPFYARLGYSTATSPVLDDSGWSDPLDQSVVLVGPDGHTTHRTGMRTHGVRVTGGLGLAASTYDVHWVLVEPGQMDYGEGRHGLSVPAGRITVVSVVQGPWEMRLSRVDSLAEGIDPQSVRLRVGGWPTTGADSLHSLIEGAGVVRYQEKAQAGPLGPNVTIPYLEYEVRVGTWVSTLIALSRGECARVDWPDEASINALLEKSLRSNG
jgi:hypothetical protein